MNCKEKMLYYGTRALSNAELLAVSINAPLKVAENVLEYNERYIGALESATAEELMQVYGIGEQKACGIVASLELARRLASDRCNKLNKRVGNSQVVADLLREEIGDGDREKFMVLHLNTKLEIIGKEVVSIGNLDSAPVHPREVFKGAIKRSSAAIIVAHNHPSGDPTPSQQDIEVTERLKQSGDVIGIKVLDHVIIGNRYTCSMKAEGYFD